MYESPIALVFSDIETKIVQDSEQMIVNAIRKVNVVVDKNELIAALDYDRNQYSKGYKDGVSDILDKIKAEIVALSAEPFHEFDYGYNLGLMEAARIIDKYKSEVKE